MHTESLAVPPIVLFVGAGLQEYTAVFETAGMWVETASEEDALPTVADLRPDLIVAEKPLESLTAEFKNIPVIAPPPPVLPETLLTDAMQLLRARTPHSTSRRSQLALVDGQLQASQDRPCPSCGDMLRWTERGTLRGIAYDYYRWCTRGCGLYCFTCTDATWVKLA